MAITVAVDEAPLVAAGVGIPAAAFGVTGDCADEAVGDAVDCGRGAVLGATAGWFRRAAILDLTLRTAWDSRFVSLVMARNSFGYCTGQTGCSPELGPILLYFIAVGVAVPTDGEVMADRVISSCHARDQG